MDKEAVSQKVEELKELLAKDPKEAGVAFIYVVANLSLYFDKPTAIGLLEFIKQLLLTKQPVQSFDDYIR